MCIRDSNSTDKTDKTNKTDKTKNTKKTNKTKKLTIINIKIGRFMNPDPIAAILYGTGVNPAMNIKR